MAEQKKQGESKIKVVSFIHPVTIRTADTRLIHTQRQEYVGSLTVELVSLQGNAFIRVTDSSPGSKYKNQHIPLSNVIAIELF